MISRAMPKAVLHILFATCTLLFCARAAGPVLVSLFHVSDRDWQTEWYAEASPSENESTPKETEGSASPEEWTDHIPVFQYDQVGLKAPGVYTTLPDHAPCEVPAEVPVPPPDRC